MLRDAKYPEQAQALTDAEAALFLTYTTGVKTFFDSVCGCDFKQSSESAQKTILNVENAGTLYKNVNTEQACYCPIKSPIKEDYYIEDESEVTFVLETADNAEVYIYKGSDRAAAESLIEDGDRLYPGNPLRFSELDDIMIVYRKAVNGQLVTDPDSLAMEYETFDASFSLTYEVKGTQYSFWQKPFVYYDDDTYWWIFRIGLCVSVALALFFCVYGCIVRPLCLNKPICCLCCYCQDDADVQSLDNIQYKGDRHNLSPKGGNNKMYSLKVHTTPMHIDDPVHGANASDDLEAD